MHVPENGGGLITGLHSFMASVLCLPSTFSANLARRYLGPPLDPSSLTEIRRQHAIENNRLDRIFNDKVLVWDGKLEEQSKTVVGYSLALLDQMQSIALVVGEVKDLGLHNLVPANSVKESTHADH